MNNSHLMVDVGNSTIIFGIFVDGKLSQTFSVVSDINHVAKLKELLEGFIKNKDINIKDFVGGMICSVVPSFTKSVQKAILETFKIECLVMKLEHFDDVKIVIDDRKQIGFDLVADVVGANNNFKLPALVVDLGTITKYLAIDKDGTLVGVSFVPGVEISFDVMGDKTAQLPSGKLLSKPNKEFGNSTLEALSGGMYYSTIGSIKEFVNQAEKKLGPVTKVLTGGLSSIFIDDLKDFAIDKDLTLKGIFEIYRNN